MSAALIRFPDGREHFAPSRSSNDPIFAVIAEHRGALEAFEASFEDKDEYGESDPDVVEAAQDQHQLTELMLLTTAPTTIAGVEALLRYLAEPVPDHSDRTTIWENAQGWSADDLSSAAEAFHRHLADALHKLIEA